MTLFDKFEAVLDTDILDSFRGFYNQPAGDLDKAMAGIFYTMVAGLIRRSNSAMSTGMMVSQIRKNYTDKITDFDFTKSKVSESQLDGIVAIGQKSISQIFPAFKSPLLNLISTYAGTGKQVTTGFIGFITSYFIKELGDMLSKDDFDTDDLIFYLQDHREPLFDKAPNDLMDKMIPALGLQEISTMKVAPAKRKEKTKTGAVTEANEEVADTSSRYIQSEEQGSGASASKWIFLALAAIALAVLVFFVLQNKDTLFEEAPSSTSVVEQEASSNVVDTLELVSEPTKPQVDPFEEFLKASDPSSLANKELIDLPAFVFENEAIELKSEDLRKADVIVKRLTENPNLQLQFIGNHKGQKDKVALKRAFAVKKYLLNKGIDNLRIDAKAGNTDSNTLQVIIISK